MKHPRRLVNFHIPDTGQVVFVAIFSLLSTLIMVVGVLLFMTFLETDTASDLPEIVSMAHDDSGLIPEDPAAELSADGGESDELTDVADDTGVVDAGDLSAGQAAGVAVVAAIMDSGDNRRVEWLSILGLALFNFCVMFAIGMVISHRIFGPIHRLRSYIKTLATGAYDKRVKLRGHDSFQTLASSLNDLATHLEAEAKKQRR